MKSPVRIATLLAVAASLSGSAFAQRPPGRKVNVDSQLMITDLRVVEDPVPDTPSSLTTKPHSSIINARLSAIA